MLREQEHTHDEVERSQEEKTPPPAECVGEQPCDELPSDDSKYLPRQESSKSGLTVLV
jgi:hypothetical protein